MAASRRSRLLLRPCSPWTVALAVFVLALLIRLAPLQRYVTPDEPIWVQRSVAFADAVAARDWAAIPQTGHPGLTTMALGALGIRITTWLHPAEAAAHLAWIRNIAWLAPENAAAFAHLAFFLPVARLLVTVITAAGVALVYGIGRRRIAEKPARWLACFLALDPFFGGLSGLLHTDALQATFTLLAVLLVLPHRQPPPVRLDRYARQGSLDPRIAGDLAIPFQRHYLDLTLAALCLALAGMTKTLGLLMAPGVALALLLLPHEPWSQRVGRVAVLTVLTTGLYLALYPPFWVDPRAALNTLFGAARYHEGIGLRDVFFAGQLTVDPGPLFYPAVLLFRLTPPVLSGLVLALLEHFSKRHLQSKDASLWWFALPALVYLVAITLATKKFDRYALSAMTLLAGVAAPTWTHHHPRWKWVLLASLLLPWALVAPLPLYYADPLVGGPWLARQVIPLGWGESDGIAATRIARLLPDASTKTLLTANVPGSASYFPGATWRRNTPLLPCADALVVDGDRAAQPGYTVAATLHLAGIPLATLYTQTLALPPDLPLVLPGPLPGAPADAIAPAADAATLRAWLEKRFTPGDTFLYVHMPDCYPLTDAQLVALLAAAPCQPADEIAGLTAEHCLMPTALPDAAPFRARFAGALDLVAAVWPPTVQATAALAVHLRWQAQVPLAVLNIYLTLRTADESLYAEGGDILVDERAWRTSTWETGAFVEGTAYIPIDLTLPPGVYTLTLSVADSQGWTGLNRPDGTFGGTRVELGQVEVIVPRYPATDLAGITPLSVPVADFSGLRLLGVGTLPTEVWAGERVPFRLAWERLPGIPPDTLHWSLACTGNVSLEGDLPLAPSAPVTWHEGHRYIAQYAPRTDPLLPEGSCTLTVAPTSAPAIGVGKVTIRQRARCFTLPQQPTTDLVVTVDDFARLLGVDAPVTLAPGDTFAVTLYLQATKTADRDYTVFVHLVGPDGAIWAQSDSWPEHGGAPTTSWVAEQIIVDAHTLTLSPTAPVGDYTVYVGLYDAERGPRVPLYNATGAPLPAERAPVQAVTVQMR